MDDFAIQELVARLARAHASGGHVIERAAIIAEGADSQAVITWIIAHGGTPEAAEATARRHGLHGALRHAGGGSERETRLASSSPPARSADLPAHRSG